jgi:hypothetical protein
MTYIITCDWCGEHIDNETDCARLPITIQRRRRNALDAKWAEETKPTLFFCVDPSINEASGSPGGCFEHAMRAIAGTPTEMPDMGMEWRLVPVGATADIEQHGRWRGNRTPAPAPVTAEADLTAYLSTLAPSPAAALRRALQRAEVLTLDQVDAMSDDDLLAIKGVSWATRCKLRAFLAARAVARGAEPVQTGGEG